MMSAQEFARYAWNFDVETSRVQLIEARDREVRAAALEEIAAKPPSCGNREAMDKARAALEAAKAPRIADNEELHLLAMTAIAKCINISDNSRETVVDAVLCVVDEWMCK